MALSATIRRFKIDLADVDHGVYDTFELQAAQHPSESDEYLVTRVLARVLEHGDGLEFGRGVSTPDDPTIFSADDTGRIELWIEVGQPAAERLHKAAKLAATVRVYTHKAPERLLADLGSGNIYRGDEITVVAFEPSFVREVAELLGRNNSWSVLLSDGTLYVTVDERTFDTLPRRFGPS